MIKKQNVFDILDYNYTENHSVVNTVHRVAFHLLGEEAVTLTLIDDKPASINQPNLRSIILRLEHAANCLSWEVLLFFFSFLFEKLNFFFKDKKCLY